MNEDLEKLRQEIDELDKQIIEMLVKRIDVVKKIGELKNLHNLPIVDEERRNKVLASVTERAKLFNLSEDFVKKIFATIHDHAVELEKKV